MSVNQDTSTHTARMGAHEQDLGPLAWVREELRKSLEGAVRTMRRFVLEAQEARESDLAALDSSPLRMAKQQLHQSAGALDMVGQPQAALLLQAMEAAVQHYVQTPNDCTDAAVQTLEKTSFALLEYLDVVLAGKQVLPVALFPQYRDVQALYGQESKVHPADLWPVERSLREPVIAANVPALPYGPEARAVLDAAVLQIVKGADPGACARLRNLSLALAQQHAPGVLRIFWKVSAGFFDAMAYGLVAPDVYAKRVASRVLMIYANLAKGQEVATDRLMQDMLFFCSQATAAPAGKAQVLQAVRESFDLQRYPRIDYEKPYFGRFDPAHLALARKRMAAAAELWSALAGGDKQKIKQVVDQFSLVSESLVQLHPSSQPLALALTHVMRRLEQTGQPPSAEVGMEVATAVLYLQAAFVSLDISEADMAAHTHTLAERLVRVLSGKEPAPLEPWMEQLYRRVSDQQTMGSVVGELRQTLSEAEKYLDQYFRAPDDVQPLQPVGGLLAQMRGVLSVLGLDPASQAMGQMRRYVESLQVGAVPTEERQTVFDKLGNSLGVLGFLIDMLSYQPSMARKLYIYDDVAGELKLIMGRSRQRQEEAPVPAAVEEAPATAAPPAAQPVAPQAKVEEAAPKAAEPQPAPGSDAALPVLDAPPQTPAAAPSAPVQEHVATAAVQPAAPAAPPSAPASTPAPAAALQAEEEDSDEELLEIFLEEATEVIGNGEAALQNLAHDAGDLGEQTVLRRAFHTLKGSSRMVGLDEFGEAAWAMEQMLNAWLAEQKPMPDAMQTLASQAMRGFAQWVQAIRDKAAGSWQATPFRASADAMRLQNKLVDLDLAAASGQAVAQPVAELQPEQLQAMETLDLAAPAQEPAAPSAPEPQVAPEVPTEAAEAAAEPVAAAETLLSVTPTQAEALAETPAPAQPETPVLDAGLDLSFAPVTEEAAAPAAEPETPASTETDLGLNFELDFSGFEAPAAEAPAEEAAPAVQDEVAAPQLSEFGLDLPELSLDLGPVAEQAPAQEQPEPQPVVEPEPVLALDTAETKVVGDLSIPLPLFNVYLAEAEVWSQNLCDSLRAWCEDVSQPQPASAHAWAHSLAGSSATVGFTALSSLARLLENALLHLQPLPQGQQEHAQVLSAAADEIRRMLHQFAAGFLAQPQADLLPRLQALLDVRVLEETPAAAQEPAPAVEQDTILNLDDFLDVAEPAQESEAAPAPADTPEPTASLEPAEPLEPTLQIELPELEAELAPIQEQEAASEPEPVAEPAQQPQAQSASAADPEAATAPATRPEPSQQVLQALQAQQELDAAMARAMAIEDDEDDDIDALDMVDPDLFPIFEEEALDLLPTLSASLREWSAHPQRTQARAVLLRALHTLKGSARLAGAMRLGEMAHRLESFLEQFDIETVTSDDLEPVFVKLDAMEAAFHVLRAVHTQEQVEQLASPVVPLADPVASAATPEAAPAAAPESAATTPAAAPVAAPPTPMPPTTVAPRAGSQALVRVRAQLLDRLVNDAGEVMITRSRLEARVAQLKNFLSELSNNLERLRHQLRDMEVQAESQMQSRQQQAKDNSAEFDPLEFDRFTRVQELTRMLAESVDDVATVQRNLQRQVTGAEDELHTQARLTRELQRDLLRTRMVEFDAVAERLYAVVRQTAKDVGKQVKLEVLGGTIEMDRGVLERMTPAFEHLLRNCVGHGIELPEQRQAAGKAAAGRIRIQVQQSGNEVSVRVEDDGAGLNIERIRAKALERGLIDADTVVDAARAAQLIFMPGFSTAEQLSGISGRGVGMDVVRSEVLALGGRIETTTEPGKGSTFELVLPLTTAVTQVVLLRAGDFIVGIPASLVEIVRRVPLADLELAYRSGQLLQADGSQLPFFWAGAVWSHSPRSTETSGGKTRPVVVVNSASQRLALHVDEVLGNQEVVVKNLGPQLARLPGLAGMSLLASGAVVLIYNPVALVAVHGDKIRALGQGLPAILDEAQARQLRQKEAEGANAAEAGRPIVQAPLVMVVDDSITVRRVTQRLLQREGFRVSTAADGLLALEKLQEELPDVVLSDIEMPRMDGFDLLRNIRSSDRLRDLPIIMITSRIAQKHRDLAMQLGANHYLGKPYGDEELLRLIRSYTEAKAPAAV